MRPTKPWMRMAVFACALAIAASSGIGLGVLLAPAEPATVPLAFYITDAPAELLGLNVTVASVTAGPDRVPLQVMQSAFDLAALQGPEAAILLAQGNVPPEAVGTAEITFASARANLDGHVVDVPILHTLVVEVIQPRSSPAFLIDVDLPASLTTGADGTISFSPVAAAVLAVDASTGTPRWMPVETTKPDVEVLEPADVVVPQGHAWSTVEDGVADLPLPKAIRTDAVFEDATHGWLIVYQDHVSRAQMRDVAHELDAVFVTSLQSMPVAYVLASQEQADLIAQHPWVERIEAEVPIHYDDAESQTAIRVPEVLDPVTGLRDAGGSPIDGRGIGVAVVDSGIDGTHPEFQRATGSVLVDNLKVVSKAYVPLINTDTTSGHGTHVAAIVAGQGADPAMRGTAPGVGLYGLGIGEASSTFWAAQAFDWILQNHDQVDPPIRVVTNSWSAGTTYDPSSVTTRMAERMVDQGIVVVFSAGNLGGDGSSTQTSAQCQIPRIICVAAYDDQGTGTRDGTIASYSSRGDASDPATWPDVSAPGTRIMSARPLAGSETGLGVMQYVELSGTSQAAPHVAGVAALMLQADSGLTPAQVEALIKSSAYPFSDGGAYATGHHAKGHGLVDAYAAVSSLL